MKPPLPSKFKECYSKVNIKQNIVNREKFSLEIHKVYICLQDYNQVSSGKNRGKNANFIRKNWVS